VVLVICLAAGNLLPAGLLLVGAAWAVVLLIDNAVPRATWRTALGLAWGIGGIGALVALLMIALGVPGIGGL
jgi:hypothetical protein